MAHQPVDLAQMFALVDEQWSPKLVARLDDHEVKVVKVKGEFVWHTHESDEMFLVLDGDLVIQLRDGDVTLTTGQMFVVPARVEHCPRADSEVHAVLIERAGMVNTGSAGGPLTASVDESLLHR